MSGRVLWESIAEKAFISATDGNFQTLEFDGMFYITDQPNLRSDIQSIDSILNYENNAVAIIGMLNYKTGDVKPLGFQSFNYILNITSSTEGNKIDLKLFSTMLIKFL